MNGYTVFNEEEIKLMRSTFLATNDIIETWIIMLKKKVCPFEDMLATLTWNEKCFEILDKQNEFFEYKATIEEKTKRLEDFWISGVPLKNICNELYLTEDEIEKLVERNQYDIKGERPFKEVKENKILTPEETKQVINYSKQPKVKKIDCIKFVEDNFHKKVHINTIYSILKNRRETWSI